MTGNINSASNYKKVEKIVVEDVEDDIDELPDSDFLKLPREYVMKWIMGRLVSFHCKSLMT